MKTDDLVTMLATGAADVEPSAARRRFALAIGWGALGASLLMAILLGVRDDLAQAAGLPMFWMKFGFVAALAAASVVAALRLSQPGVALGGAPIGMAAPLLAIWALAGAVLLAAEPAERAGLVFGQTWATCPLNITVLSVPTWATAMWAMKGLAPTRLRLAGGVAGLLAGAVAAMVYALHCPEMAAPFLAIWYVLGILIPAALGALLGPRLLRW